MKFKPSTLLRFATVQVTVLTTILYAAVFISVLVCDELAPVPQNTGGLDLDRAYEALSRITVRPRPYISHANDDVRNYILTRLQPLAERYDNIYLSDDTFSNTTFNTGRNYAVYFESLNVLLRIDGTDSPHASPEPGPDGVLFSCHFDSVSTGLGATDDGMAVATLLELAEYLSLPENRPRRTAIFFFNNGEEDYLNGAHAYYEHPWSNLTSVFINLEGAASGGRPLVFRSTSYGAARSLITSDVKHPHGSSLTSDAFAAGAIRSATDYEVYARGVEGVTKGMEGFDFAFYKNRAYYHTLRDSIPGMGQGEGRKALWAMMELTRGAGLRMLNDDEWGTDARPSVYFDLYGRALVMFPMDAVYAFNVALMVIGPLSTIGLIAWVMLAAKEHSDADRVIARHQGLSAKFKLAKKAVSGWGRFWIALIVCALVHSGLVAGFVRLNPYVIHSHGYAVMTVFLALSFLALVMPLQGLHYLLPPTFVSQKLAVSLSLYSFTWLLLLASTVGISLRQLGSLYWTTVFNFCAWLACVLELVRAGRRRDPGNELGRHSELFSTLAELEANAEGEVPGRRLVHGVLYEAAPSAAPQESIGPAGGEEVETDPTEITPLMHQHRRVSQSGREYVTLDEPGDVKLGGRPAEEYGWWIAQIVLLVPSTAILLFQVEVLLLNALRHTLVDGSSPALVYEALALLSVLIFVPLAPFAHKLSRTLNAAVFVVFAVLLVACWTAFPFTLDAPFRVYFQQFVELAPPMPSARGAPAVVRAETTITGLRGFVDRYVAGDIPSARASTSVDCNATGLRPDLMTCKWATDLLPSPGNASAPGSPPDAVGGVARWLDVSAERVNATRARVAVRGENTRGCRLYLDRPVNFFYVYPEGERGGKEGEEVRMRMQGGYGMPAGGITEARLWSRTWGREFVVELGWEGLEGLPGLSGRAACEYAEYASALESDGGGRIPAFEEVKDFMPLWAQPTKLADGLVEVWTRFEA